MANGSNAVLMGMGMGGYIIGKDLLSLLESSSSSSSPAGSG
jgi:hypothetical protein